MLCPSKLHHGLPAFKVAGHAARAIALAQRVEVRAGLRGCLPVVICSANSRPVAGPCFMPHMPCPPATKMRFSSTGPTSGRPSGLNGRGPNPYLVALRPANPVEEPACRIDNGVDHGSRRGGVGTTQLHHAGDPQLPAQRRARHPHIRQIDRPENLTLHRHREGVATPGLHRNPNPAADQFRQPRAGRDHRHVGRQRRTTARVAPRRPAPRSARRRHPRSPVPRPVRRLSSPAPARTGRDRRTADR